MSEDGTKCDVILTTDFNAKNGILRVDSEKRNHCWKKSSGKYITEEIIQISKMSIHIKIV
jgi:hypothetical protein